MKQPETYASATINELQPAWYRGWLSGYWRFMRNPRESTALKVASIAVTGLLPPEFFVAFFPGFDVEDIPYGIVAATVALKTIERVHEYRKA